MPQERLQKLLLSLRDEINQLDNLDDPTVALVNQLDGNLEVLIDSIELQEAKTETPMDTALALEAHFASKHPTVERVVREIIDTLNKIGV